MALDADTETLPLWESFMVSGLLRVDQSHKTFDSSCGERSTWNTKPRGGPVGGLGRLDP